MSQSSGLGILRDHRFFELIKRVPFETVVRQLGQIVVEESL
ncbi:hypothetical protein [Tumebacillus algifaecis]|nr:hypothetical protein [Tumebacillus algifaecis]